MLKIFIYSAFVSVSLCYNLPTYIPAVTPAVVPAMLFSDRNGHTKGSGVLQMKVREHRPSLNALRKRQSLDPLANVINGYTIDISLGTPPQDTTVIMDIGSSELWVDPVCANSWSPTLCNEIPRYTPGASSSHVDLNKPFSIQYGSGDVSGEYLTDNITMGSAMITAQQFGWANTSTYTIMGIMGVGFGYQLDTNYYNIIDQLFLQGVTKSRAFSLDLASIDAADGSIIFGGIDTMRYIGALEKRPIIPYNLAPDGYPRYWIYMTSVGITQPGNCSSTNVTGVGYNQAIFPDSGSTLSALPTALFNALLAYFPDAVSQGGGTYTVPCSYRTQAGTIDFGFGGTVIHVNYHEWFWFDGAQCWFGAQSAASTWTLGDSFMRSAYLVYDQDNANVLLAQAANCGSNITAITTGVNAVPSITGGCPVTSTSLCSSSRSSSSSTKTSSSHAATTPSSSTAKTTSSSPTVLVTPSSTPKTASVSPTVSSTVTSKSSSSSVTASSTPPKSNSISSSPGNPTPSTSSASNTAKQPTSTPTPSSSISSTFKPSTTPAQNIPSSKLSSIKGTSQVQVPTSQTQTQKNSNLHNEASKTSPGLVVQFQSSSTLLVQDPAAASQCCGDGGGGVVYVTRLTVVVGVDGEGWCAATATAVGRMG